MRAVVMMLALIGPGLGGVAQADVLSSKSQVKLFKSQTRVLDERANLQRNASIRLDPVSVHVPTKWGAQGYDGGYDGPYLDMARSAAARHGVPEDLFLRLVQQESGFNARAISPKGALGLAQLMPQTARNLGVDPHDPYENLDGGARYLAQQYRRFGTWRLARAAYTAGPEAVEKHGGVPPYRETRDYVKVIWGS
ncbi:MAG: lytic transglycosylase domain-containing protein [Thalassovita sp.]|nr:lytic transglycosylase domain-containing protein [Thalassovita sp.]